MNRTFVWMAFMVALSSDCSSAEAPGADTDANDRDGVTSPLALSVGAFVEPQPYYPGQLASTYVAATLSGGPPWPEVHLTVTSAPPGVAASVDPERGLDLGADERPAADPRELRSTLRWSLAEDLAPGRYTVSFRASAAHVTSDGSIAFDVVAADTPGLVGGADARFVLVEDGGVARFRVRATAIGGASGHLEAAPLTPQADLYGREPELTMRSSHLDANASTDVEVQCAVPVRGVGGACGVRLALGRHVVDVPIDVYTRRSELAQFELLWLRHHALLIGPDGADSVAVEISPSDGLMDAWPPTIEGLDAPPGLVVTAAIESPPTLRVHVRADASAGALVPGRTAIGIRVNLAGHVATASLPVLILPTGGEWPMLGGGPLPLRPAAFGLDHQGHVVVSGTSGLLRWSGSAWDPAAARGVPFVYTSEGALWEVDTTPSLTVTKNGMPQVISVDGHPRDAFIALDRALVDAQPLVLVDLPDRPLQLYRTPPSIGLHTFFVHSTLPQETVTRDTFPRLAAHDGVVYVLLRGAPGLSLWGYEGGEWTPRAVPEATLGPALPHLSLDPAGVPILAWLDPEERLHVQRSGPEGWRDIGPALTHPGRVVLAYDLAVGPDDRVTVLVRSADSVLGGGARLDLVREGDSGFGAPLPIARVDPQATIDLGALIIDPSGATFVLESEGTVVSVRWRSSP